MRSRERPNDRERQSEVTSTISFLSSHGGSSNAETTFERITFHFEVSLDALKASLRRFAKVSIQFFWPDGTFVLKGTRWKFASPVDSFIH